MWRFTAEFPVPGSYRQENLQPRPHAIQSLTHRTKQKAKSCTRGLMHASGGPVVTGGRNCRAWDAAASLCSKGDKRLLPVTGIYPTACHMSKEPRTCLSSQTRKADNSL